MNNQIYKDVTLNADSVSIVLDALEKRKTNLSNILEKLSLDLHASYTDTEIRGVQNNMTLIVEQIRTINMTISEFKNTRYYTK